MMNLTPTPGPLPALSPLDLLLALQRSPHPGPLGKFVLTPPMTDPNMLTRALGSAPAPAAMPLRGAGLG